MLFDSLVYALFLPVVFLLYWLVFKTKKQQNILICIASFVFYGAWNQTFLILLAGSILINYLTGIGINRTSKQKKKKAILIVSLIINLGVLCFFKYYNFFVDSFADLLHIFGLQSHLTTLQIILPVGISFYTFHGLSYIIDIYYGKIKPTRNLIDYSLFVSFFPLLVAGPIERATHLLPQIQRKRTFEYLRATSGLKQILWGLFKKSVIADSCAPFVNGIFSHSDTVSSPILMMGAVLFLIQLYCDFSGYSDIALGSARLLGFELIKNFNYPFFSRNIAEYWRRWHISLTTWFRDYLYIPLGGSRNGKAKQIRNTIIIFVVSGFWHGANWTYIAWGALNALFIIPSILMKTNRKMLDVVAQGKMIPSLKEVIQIITTFALATFTFIIFRAESITHAFHYIKNMLSFNDLSFMITFHINPPIRLYQLGILIVFTFAMEWCAKEKNFGLDHFAPKIKRPLRWFFYFMLIFFIIRFTPEIPQAFVYFQF